MAMVSRIRRVLVASAIALAALASTSASASASSAGEWNLFYQVHASGFFSSVVAISKTDAWAAAEMSSNQPLVRHWNGRSWTAVTIPGASGFTSDWVGDSGAKNVWVMGPGASRTKAYRFDGSKWHSVAVPAQTYLWDPAVFGTNDVWAIGSSLTSASNANVFHWNGTRWVGYTLNANVQELSGTWGKDVWAVGLTYANPERVAAYYWNGSRWRSVSMPHPVTDEGDSIHVSSISNVWINGGNANSTYLLHWNGRGWHQMTAPSSLPCLSGSLVPYGSAGLWCGPLSLWTGSAWKGPIQVSPEFSSGGFGPMDHVPGTSSYWAASGTTNVGSKIEEPSIYLYGPVP